jgi:hypothetical protein
MKLLWMIAGTQSHSPEDPCGWRMGPFIIDVLDEENEEGDENRAEDEVAEEQEMDDANNEQVILGAEEIDDWEQEVNES